jgi:NADPH-dependent glutamate synthase beta subunit-like oxidoreductase/NAD(P)H-flavin reductase
MNQLRLNIQEFSYYDLHKPAKLAELTQIFYNEVRVKNSSLFERFEKYKSSNGVGFTEIEISNLLVEMAQCLSSFLATMFGVENECSMMQLRTEQEQIIFTFKKEFFIRRALKKITRDYAKTLDLQQLNQQVETLKSCFQGFPHDDSELETATIVLELLSHERFIKTSLPENSQQYVTALCDRLKKEQPLLNIIPSQYNESSLKTFLSSVVFIFEQWLATQYYNHSEETKDWVTFRLPQQLDYQHLVNSKVLNVPVPNINIGHEEHYRRRDGFDLTDTRYTQREVMNEVDYCILCHERDKDSCTKGLREAETFKKNPLGYALKGCPLDQKISESHTLKGRGDAIGALALIMIDNPMVPGTGHRICNDCMKACIYQKQDPVNIPQIETRVLMDVLELPWGFEIYSLLTRWNPLNIQRPHALPYNGKKILVVGLGPAGYTLAHYFLNEGFGVIGIDGLKIEPLPEALVGSETKPFQPIRDYSSIYKNLSERSLMGFGGVSEYGITVRWDKNFLTVIYLNLIRREHFRIYDGVRFGGTLNLEDAWKYGFNHVCIASGAGKPTLITMKSNLIQGIRKASDFLMSLQLTGAGKKDSMANLQVHLPALVIGGGLTAIDTATELMAYYPVQVTKIKERYEDLVIHFSKENVDKMFDQQEAKKLRVFLDHANAIEQERKRAAASGEAPNFIPLISEWGGVHIYYRKSMVDSPAYRLNHEEVIKSLEEGISFVENMNPLEAVPDEFGAVKELVFERMTTVDGKSKNSGEMYRVPARTVMVAAGTVPNVMYEQEHPGTFNFDEQDKYFQTYTLKEGATLVEARKDEVGFYTSYEKDGKYVTFYGDNHPEYAGNVVKAMASAKHGYKTVLALYKKNLKQQTEQSDDRIQQNWKNFVSTLDDNLKAQVVEVNRLTPTITEVIVRAPQAAREFYPGQFYRLQSYEADSPFIYSTRIMMEGIALTGAWVNKTKGLISLIVLEVGASSRMVSMLKPGQRVVVMGPTGCPTEITENGTALLLGGGLGNAVLFSIAKAFKEKNNKVIYFAAYKKKEDFFKREEIEAATDIVVYSVDSGKPIETNRPQDKTFVGNIIQAMLAYSQGELGSVPIPLSDAGRVIAIGSDRMMAAVTQARHGVLKPYLYEHHIGIASINSPMQCMMKAVCAQCLQRHVDPETGKEEFVFSCVNQDQLMNEVDFSNLNARIRANSLMEKITNRWLDLILDKYKLDRV